MPLFLLQMANLVILLNCLASFPFAGWRRIQEDNPKSSLQLVKAGSKRIYTVSDAGKILRSWNTNTGAVLWQKTLCADDTR